MSLIPLYSSTLLPSHFFISGVTSPVLHSSGHPAPLPTMLPSPFYVALRSCFLHLPYISSRDHSLYALSIFSPSPFLFFIHLFPFPLLFFPLYYPFPRCLSHPPVVASPQGTCSIPRYSSATQLCLIFVNSWAYLTYCLFLDLL